MKSRFHGLPGGALFALALAIGSQTGSAQAQPAQGAAPSISSTLDVCEDSATGLWRYSGVVSVAGATERSAAGLSVDYWVQNKVSRDGYKNAYQAKQASGGTVQAEEALVVPFSVDAPPLTLGTLRGAARVQADAKAAALVVEGAELTLPVCGCGPTGCVRSKGYWGKKPDVRWPGEWYREMNFYASGHSWQQILDSKVRGNGYVMVAQQFIAAVLNRNDGASAPQGVQDVMAKARDWFASGATLATCADHGSCKEQKTWAAVLDVYNNGKYPGGPPHCDDKDKDGHDDDGDYDKAGTGGRHRD